MGEEEKEEQSPVPKRCRLNDKNEAELDAHSSQASPPGTSGLLIGSRLSLSSWAQCHLSFQLALIIRLEESFLPHLESIHYFAMPK